VQSIGCSYAKFFRLIARDVYWYRCPHAKTSFLTSAAVTVVIFAIVSGMELQRKNTIPEPRITILLQNSER
jgi:hypothetical protein